MSSLMDIPQSKRLKENIQKQIEHITAISKYLEKENEVEFFKNASVIFEKLFKKYYRDKNKNATYATHRKWLFEQLKKYYPNIITYSDSIEGSLGLLSQYRNELMHELEPNTNTEKLKEKLIIHLRKALQIMLGLNKNIEEYNNEEIENKFKNMFEKGGISLDDFIEDSIRNIQQNESRILTYDMQLYIIISTLYSTLYGLIIGIIKSEIETLENIHYEVVLDDLNDLKQFDNKEAGMYSSDTRLFIKLKDSRRYQLMLKKSFTDEYRQSILNFFKKKRKVRIHQKNNALTVEFCEDFMGMS